MPIGHNKRWSRIRTSNNCSMPKCISVHTLLQHINQYPMPKSHWTLKHHNVIICKSIVIDCLVKFRHKFKLSIEEVDLQHFFFLLFPFFLPLFLLHNILTKVDWILVISRVQESCYLSH